MIARVMRDVAPPAAGIRETSLLKWSRWALLATIAGLPTYVVRWRYGPLPTTLLESLIIVTVGLYVVARWRDGWRRPLSTPLDIPILLLLLAGAISVFVARDHRGALGLYRAYFVEPVAVFYVAVDLLRRIEDLGRALLALAAGSSAFAILNLIVFAQTVANHQFIVGSPPSALYGDSNYVAMYLEPPVALAAGLVLFASNSRWRWLGAGWLAITGTALFVMFSKGTYLAMAVLAFAVILFGLLSRGWRAWPRTQGFYRAVLWGVLGALVLWTVHGLVDSPYWKNDMSVEFWVLAAIELVILGRREKPATLTST